MGGGVARGMVVVGSVGAAVGLTTLGMAMSYIQPVQGLIVLSLVLMIGGVIALAVGLVAVRATEPPARDED